MSRVVWQEGMPLAQHHFQQQARFFEQTLQAAVEQLFFQPSGLIGLRLDPDALRNGTAALLHARGAMPDGLAFHCPQHDPLPAPIDIASRIGPTQESALLHLAIPPYLPNQRNAGDDKRFRRIDETVRDDAAGLDERRIEIAAKNLTLTLEPGDLVALPIARIQRDRSGRFEYDATYIPPLLHVAASPRLVALVASLVDAIEAKSDSLRASRPATAAGQQGYAGTEVADFWLAHVLHAALPALRHVRDVGTTHPEALYVELARLAGALCTFALDAHPRDIAPYRHDDLTGTFASLERFVRARLGVVAPSGAVRVSLARKDDLYHIGTVTDPRLMGPAQWFLAIRATGAAATVATRVPELVKVCSAIFIERLVREAYPGMTLTHVPTPPPRLAPLPDRLYFAIDRAGPCWQSITQSAGVGVYVPAAIQALELELLILPADDA